MHVEINDLLFTSQVVCGEPNPRLFSLSQLSKAEDRLGLSSKCGSTTAYQALLSLNITKRRVYCN